MAITRVNPADWAVGDKLTSAQANGLDENGAKAVDKTSAGDTVSGELTFDATGSILLDAGSSMTVDVGAQIEVGGGLVIPSPGVLQADLGTSSSITVGSGSHIATAGTGYVKFNNSDWPKLNTRTRSISRNFRELSIADPNLFPTDWQSSSFGFISGMASAEILALRVPLHEGARLIGMAVYMKAAAHAGVPATMPRVEFFKRTKFGATSASEVHSYPTPLLAAWNNVNITDWSITLTTPQTIDSVTYDYSIDFYDEHDANSVSGNRYYAIEFLYDSITDMRFQ